MNVHPVLASALALGVFMSPLHGFPQGSDPEEQRVAGKLNELVKGPRKQGGTQRGGKVDPVGKLVDGIRVESTHAKLRELGSLAVPSIVKRIDALDVEELRLAVGILVENPEPLVFATLERMLGANDIVRQAIAADALAHLPPERTRDLARKAVQAQHARVRIGGYEVLAALGETDGVVAALGRAAGQGGHNVRSRVIGLLSGPRFRAMAGVDQLLAELVFDRHAPVRDEAIAAWFDGRAAADEAKADAIFERMTRADSRRAFIERVVDQKLPWRRILLGGIREKDFAQKAFALIVRHDLPVPEQDLVDTLRSSAWEVRYHALRLLHRRSGKFAQVVLPLLQDEDSDVYGAAFGYLRTHAPKELLERAGELLGGDALRSETIAFLLEHGDHRAVGAAMGELRSLEQDAHGFRALARVVTHRSDASNLDELLGLAAIPAPQQHAKSWDAKVDAVATALLKWFDASCIERALRRLDRVDARVAAQVLERTRVTATPEHTELVAELVQKSLADPRSDPWKENPLENPLPAGDRAAGLMRILAAIGTRDAIATVERLLAHERDEVKTAACTALVASSHRDLGPLVRSVLAENRASPRLTLVLEEPKWLADGALRALAIERLLALPGDEEVHRATLERFFTRLPVDERRALAVGLVERSRDPRRVAADHLAVAIGVLGGLRDGALAPTIAIGLAHPDSDLRWAVIQELGRMLSREAAPFLIEALRDDEPGNASAASSALERLSSYLAERAKWEARFNVPARGGKKDK